MKWFTFTKVYSFKSSDIEYLKDTMPDTVEPEFFEFLSQINADDVTVSAISEGKVVFPRYVKV